MTNPAPPRRERSPLTLSLGFGHLMRIKRDQLAFYADMRARHGDVVRLRLGPYRSWLLFHPDDVEAVLVHQWQSFIRFEKLTQVVAQWTGTNMLLAEGDAWRARRRKVLPAFARQRLPDYGAKAVLHTRRLGEAWAERADDRGEVTIETDAAMARLTLDIAADTFFSSPPPPDGDVIEAAIQTLSETAFRESTAPLVLPDWLPLAAKRRKRRAIGVMDEFVCRLVDARLAEAEGDRGDLLSMLAEQHAGDRTAIRNDAMSLLIAGHETSGAVLGWTAHCLVQSPLWRERLCAELGAVLQGAAPRPEDLPRLPVLRAVIMEVLRLYPPAYALFLRRATCDVAMPGFNIRKGDLVQITPFALHRDPRWFTEPDRFDPDRFLAGEAALPKAYVPFGNGPRICIGQGFGMMEVCLVVASLLQRWVPVAGPAVVIPEPRFSLRPRGGLAITWRQAGRAT